MLKYFSPSLLILQCADVFGEQHAEDRCMLEVKDSVAEFYQMVRCCVTAATTIQCSLRVQDATANSPANMLMFLERSIIRNASVVHLAMLLFQATSLMSVEDLSARSVAQTTATNVQDL